MRAIILETLYECSKKPYQRFVTKRKPWQVSLDDLLHYNTNTLGYHLACFLLKYNFELQAKLENHDIFHVLTNTGVSVPEEISMQYYLWGNGKRSPYQFSVICLGTLLFPDYLSLFTKAYSTGKKALSFHQLEFSKLLNQPMERIKSIFKIK
jgi:ubiquinone biosynthesis protein Coq4